MDSSVDVAPALPDLSVILPFRESFGEICSTISALQRQTAAGKIEIVMVAPSRARAGVNASELRAFCSWQVVEHPLASHGRMYAAGIRHARAPLAVLTEDHVFPARDWAEKLIGAHSTGDWAAVGPAFRNANPATLVSWADFYIAYGKWAIPIESQEMDYLPGHNSCYRRVPLLAYGERLESMLESEVVMHWDLRGRGFRLWLEGSTYTEHLNFARFRVWLGAQLFAGRLFAAQRALRWQWGKRAVYALGSPLIPFVRFWRTYQDTRRARLPIFFRWRLYVCIMVGLGADAVGQFLGYLSGIGEHTGASMTYEFGRERYL